jgi:hypothetical protein
MIDPTDATQGQFSLTFTAPGAKRGKLGLGPYHVDSLVREILAWKLSSTYAVLICLGIH